jgi:hypothetical protein
MWVPNPAATAQKLRVEVDVYRNNSSNHIKLAPLATGPSYVPDSWIETAVSVYSNVTQTPPGAVQTTTARVNTNVGIFPSALQQQGAWSTIRQDVDRDARTTSVWANGVLLGTWPIAEIASTATFIVLNSNGSGGSYCWRNLKVYSSP